MTSRHIASTIKRIALESAQRGRLASPAAIATAAQPPIRLARVERLTSHGGSREERGDPAAPSLRMAGVVIARDSPARAREEPARPGEQDRQARDVTGQDAPARIDAKPDRLHDA